MSAKNTSEERNLFQYNYGEFQFITCYGRGKRKLTECPICALDPDRERTTFGHHSRPDVHFLNEHDADDIGRPMAELLPDPEGRHD